MGSPRITAGLNEAAQETGGRVNRKRVARPVRAAGIAGYRRRRRVRTTAVDQASAGCPDLLKRDLTAPAPQPQVRRRHSPAAWELPPPACP